MLLKENGKGTSKMQDVELLLALRNKLKILLVEEGRGSGVLAHLLECRWRLIILYAAGG